MSKAVDDLEWKTMQCSHFRTPSSAHVEKAIRLLEQRYQDTEQKGISKGLLKNMQESLDLMKRKLELVTRAEEKAPKET
jgi:hypothetical protein